MQKLNTQTNQMATLDTITYPQDPLTNYNNFKDLYTSGWEYNYYENKGDHGGDFLDHGGDFLDHEINNGSQLLLSSGNNNCYWDESSSSVMQSNVKVWEHNSSPEGCAGGGEGVEATTVNVERRRKRRRTRSSKNKEELESQRMTHIAVERNRRKQMNDYLAIIRSLMPPSYVQRGDQASIIGGAINFVKELEQQLQTIEAQTRANELQQQQEHEQQKQLFGDFFTYPQYTRCPNTCVSSGCSSNSTSEGALGFKEEMNNGSSSNNVAGFGEIEVTMVENHGNLKILTKKRPKQLIKIVSGLQCLWLTILHLNVTTTVDHMALYTISVKLEEGCQLTTVEEIADFVNHLLGRIEEESAMC